MISINVYRHYPVRFNVQLGVPISLVACSDFLKWRRGYSIFDYPHIQNVTERTDRSYDKLNEKEQGKDLRSMCHAVRRDTKCYVR